MEVEGRRSNDVAESVVGGQVYTLYLKSNSMLYFFYDAHEPARRFWFARIKKYGFSKWK